MKRDVRVVGRVEGREVRVDAAVVGALAWPCSRSGPTSRGGGSPPRGRPIRSPAPGARARRACRRASRCRSLPCQAETSRASSAQESSRGEDSVSRGSIRADRGARRQERGAAPPRRRADPLLEELEDPGLAALVLAEGLEVHEERDDVALARRRSSGRTSPGVSGHSGQARSEKRNATSSESR